MSTSAIGSAFAIATGVPSAFTEVGYEAMTWVDCAGLVSIGERGDSHETIPVPDLKTGRVKTIKGETTGKVVSLAFRDVPADAGQAALIAANNTFLGEFSFRISDPGAAGAAEYYTTGIVMNLVQKEKSGSSYKGFTVEVTNNYGEVSGT